MAVSTSTVTRPFKKFVPAAKGVIQTSVVGVGFDQIAKTVDGVFGSPVQRIFSFNFPLVGPIGPIDIINYLVNGNGKLISGKGATAVLAAKLVQTGNLAGFNLIPTLRSTPATTVSVAGASGSGPTVGTGANI